MNVKDNVNLRQQIFNQITEAFSFQFHFILIVKGFPANKTLMSKVSQ
jgi:hypothetical protein